MATRLESYLTALARQRGFREAMMGRGGGQPAQGQSGGGQKAQPQAGMGSQRSANQQGGMAQPGMLPGLMMPQQQAAGKDGQGGGFGFGDLLNAGVGFLTGGPIGAGASILGSVIGASRGSSSSSGSSGATGTPSTGSTYAQVQQRALSGQGAMPSSLLQGALSQGLGLVNAQAQQSRENVGTNLAQRGLSQSGIYGSAMADIEGSRLQALGSLGQQLAQQQFQYSSQAQEGALNREAGMMQQQAGIRAQQPEWYDYLIQAAPAIGQYVTSRNQQPSDIAALAAALGLSPRTDVPVDWNRLNQQGWDAGGR